MCVFLDSSNCAMYCSCIDYMVHINGYLLVLRPMIMTIASVVLH